MDDFRTIGARIRQARVKKKLTQVELATAIGVVRSHLTNAENGKNGLALDKLSAVAHETGTSVAWLIGEDVSADQERALISVFQALSRNDRDTVLRIAEGFLGGDQAPRPAERPPPSHPIPGGSVLDQRSRDCVVAVRHELPLATA